MLKKSISVILPNYNGAHLLKEYLPSVFQALHFSKIDYEIILIDDASKDQSIAFITNNYPEINIIKNDKNLGFSKTCNKGIAKAQKDLIFLLNTDVALEEDYFENQFQYFQLPTTFGVMGRIMNFDGKKIEDAARTLRLKGCKLKANKFYFVSESTEPVYTAYLSGANALIDRKKLQILNGFDEIYSPFYFEDFDLGLRAWQLGWRCIYEHQSVCYHKVSASTNTMNKSNFVKITYNRNSFILQAIHIYANKNIFWNIQIFINTVLNRFIQCQFWIYKSYFGYLKMNKKIMISQKRLRELKKNHDSKNINEIIELIDQSMSARKINYL
ncbi:glycosyltransferase family 2 protein [Flavobacterium branchiophilum]|uniref:Glycosyl transferase n=1 Tax=Flavobacterium branchiophilum TaxID=55197 RepID=A0A2H3KEQ3_9FLAO|nr:glycosyltransferase family 2 protein [Flavobacterium branchiophilum]PDS26840.1 glycosyl transferase [Flavobacterium branchiophilum]